MIRMRSRGAPLLLPFVMACGTSEAEDAPSLQTAAVIRGDLMITAEATGNVEPIRTVEVTSKASGEVLRLHVDVGDVVEPGALLAEVDPRDVQNDFNQMQADLQVAQARLDISQQQLDRSEELLQAGVISTQEHETRTLDFANSEASLVRAETNFQLSQLRLEDVVIRSPLAGTVLEKNVEEGQVIQSASQNVSGGTTLVIMADLASMQVRTLVDETDMGAIRAGMPANVTVEAYPDQTFVGIVEKIEPQAVVQQNVTMFPVIVQLDNSSGLLRPGMNAEVVVELAQATGVLLIPNNAVVTPQDAQPAAMVLGLDPEAIDARSLFGGLGGRGGGRAQRQGGGPGGGEPGTVQGRQGGGGADASGGTPSGAQGEAQAGGGQGAGGGGAGGRGFGAGRGFGNGRGGASFDSIRALVASGEISQDSARALFGGRGGGAAGRGFGGGGRGGRSAQGGGDPGQGAQDVANRQRETRRAVVFVMAEGEAVEPRAVMIGLNDWDFTEVVSGLEEGDLIAVVGAAQLRASQDEFLNRIRSNSSNPFGGGGPGRGGGGGFRR